MKNNRIKDVFSNVAKSVRVFALGNLEVKVSVILNKKDITDLSRAYVLVSTRDITSENKKWKFSYRSKMNSLQLVYYTDLDFGNIIPTKVIKSTLWFEYGGSEWRRFEKFAMSKGISYLQLQTRFKEACREATVKYLKAVKEEDAFKPAMEVKHYLIG